MPNDPNTQILRQFGMLVIEPVLWATVEVLGRDTMGHTIRVVRQMLRNPTALTAVAIAANDQFCEGVPDSDFAITPMVVHAVLEATQDVLGGEINLNGVAVCLKDGRGQEIVNCATELYENYPPTHLERAPESN